MHVARHPHRAPAGRRGAALTLGRHRAAEPRAALTDLADTLGPWTYLLVGGLAFLETGAFVGLIAPGETAIVLGGVVAAAGRVSTSSRSCSSPGCAPPLGDLVSLRARRRLGRPFLHKHGPRVGSPTPRLERVERFYDRHGGKAILVGRFVGLVRAVSPFLAGASGLRLRAFLPWSLIGTAVWASAFTLAGYVLPPLLRAGRGNAHATARSRSPSCCDRAGRAIGAAATRTPIRSTTNTSVSFGPITPPAPRVP